jgi:2-dehydro-3-deoxy-L-rhamnonate dehydrogenase (NAD+)
MIKYNGFENQVGIITGAASGIGLAIAKKLASYNVRLALLDNNRDLLLELQTEFPDNTTFCVIDITNEDDIKKNIAETAEHFGSIDILVNSAGITGKTNIKSHEVEYDNLKQVFDVNFKGSFYTSKYVLPWMLKNNYGRILHIASIAGKEGNAGMLAYSASKAAVIAMTKVQGKEYAQTNITINALAPAVIETALVKAMPQEQVTYMTDKIPMRRCGTLEEVADMAAYIVSKETSFTTGFTFDLSGGRATY